MVLWKKVFYYQKLAEIGFPDGPFIYLVIAGNPATRKFRVLETGYLKKISCHLAYSERRNSWKKLSPKNNLWVCVLQVPEWSYTPQESIKIIQKLNKICKPVYSEVENIPGQVNPVHPLNKKFYQFNRPSQLSRKAELG